MKMEKNFARRLNWQPLVNSLIFGASIGMFFFILLNNYFGAGVLTGVIAFLVQSMIVYPHYLPSFYGHWRITDRDIYYYDYGTWIKRVMAVFLPSAKKENVISFEDMLSYALVVSKVNDKWTPHYIILHLNNGANIALDLSWNLSKTGEPQEDVEWVVDFITSKLHQKTVEVLQSK